MTDLGLLRPPGTVLFGVGVVEALGEVVSAFGRRVVVCTDPVLAATPHATAVLGSLERAGLEVTVLDAAQAELPVSVIEGAVERLRAIKPDCIVGFGGGSCLDFAKLGALGLAYDQPLSEFYGDGLVPGPVVPVVAVPTTAGTGSEVTPVAVVSDPAIELKVGISSAHLVPRAAICDPLLTHGAPPKVTAYAGIDALAHAVEAFTAIRRPSWADAAGRGFIGANVLSDRFALHAIERIAGSLVAAIDDDPAARAAMLEGSLCAGLAFATAGTAAAHALQYPIGAATKTPHGLGVGMLLPYAMRFNRDDRRAELAQVALALGCDTADADAAIAAVLELGRRIGLPASLQELDVREEDLPRLARAGAGITRLASNNARPLSEEGALAILQAVWRGDPASMAA